MPRGISSWHLIIYCFLDIHSLQKIQYFTFRIDETACQGERLRVICAIVTIRSYMYKISEPHVTDRKSIKVSSLDVIKCELFIFVITFIWKLKITQNNASTLVNNFFVSVINIYIYIYRWAENWTQHFSKHFNVY